MREHLGRGGRGEPRETAGYMARAKSKLIKGKGCEKAESQKRIKGRKKVDGETWGKREPTKRWDSDEGLKS